MRIKTYCHSRDRMNERAPFLKQADLLKITNTHPRLNKDEASQLINRQRNNFKHSKKILYYLFWIDSENGIPKYFILPVGTKKRKGFIITILVVPESSFEFANTLRQTKYASIKALR